jgi:nucleotide-binding universal stress UspA family protein
MPIKNILIPTDFSENADKAIAYAALLAETLSAKIHLLHVPVIPTYLVFDASYTPGPKAVTQILERGQQWLDGVEQRLSASSSAPVQSALREGVVHEAIRAYAEEREIDLLVMGSHGRTGFSKFMYGSVTERVLKTSPVPTLVVPLKASLVVPKSIVVAYDFSAPAREAVQLAAELRTDFQSTLTMVHSYLDLWGEYTDRATVVGEAADNRREALRLGLREMLEADAANLTPAGATAPEVQLCTGDPVQAVLELAQGDDATLIAAGTTGKTGIERLLMGSFARRLLHESPVPVLFAHGSRDEV